MQSRRVLNTFSLPTHVEAKLFGAGFKVVGDLVSRSPLSLSKDADISYVEAAKLLDLVFSDEAVTSTSHCGPRVTAFELLQQEQDPMCIVTFSHALDKVLDGGIPLGKTTEICGAPGTGKTQLCIQLCVDVQIPEELGGVGGEAVYIDTDGGFRAERLLDMAEGCVQHCHTVCQKDPMLQGNADSFTVDGILRGVHYYHCFDYVELVALINTLPDFLHKHPKVRLVVIDSIAFYFKHGFEGNFAGRSRILSSLVQSLIRLAFESQLAVVLTNQMTTRIDAHGASSLVPALGEGWSHACALRIVLHQWEEQRRALLVKSPNSQQDVATFQILSAGIRDIAGNVSSNGNLASISPQSSPKRPKLNS